VQAIPLENATSPPHPRHPYVNYGLIVLLFLVYAWELALGPGLPKVVGNWGFVPAHLVTSWGHPQEFFFHSLSLFSALFLHGNFLHLLYNAMFLFIFGNKVEGLLGHGRYLFLYLLSGVGANLIYLFSASSSTFAIIGASGAIAGVMAGYFSLFPRQRFTTLFIIIWVILQFLNGVHGSRLVGAARMAWWTHVGGFLLGLALVRFLAPRGLWLIPITDSHNQPSKD
jgi:membrane associated rhomboid family serine protease